MKVDHKKRRAHETKNAECNLDSSVQPSGDSKNRNSIQSLLSVLRSSRYIQVLIILTIVGLFLRFYNLTFNSIWLDEAMTFYFAQKSPLDYWSIIAEGGEFHPPLYYWLVHYALSIGNNEYILRFIPALVGFLTIPLIYFVGSEFIDRNVGILSAALLTFSPFHIFYSQESRAYTLVLFFFSIALIYYFRALRRNNWFEWSIFGFFAALSVWAHFYVGIAIVLLFLYALGDNLLSLKGNIRKIIPFIMGFLVFFVVCFPLLLLGVNLFFKITSSAPTYGLQGLSVINVSLEQFSCYNILVLGVFLALFLLGCIQLIRKKSKSVVLIALILGVSFLLSVILSSKMPMIPRYLIFLLPFYFFGISFSYNILYELVRDNRIIYIFILIFIILSLPFLTNYYSTYTKEDWRGLAPLITDATKGGEVIVLIPAYMKYPFDYYYSNLSDQTYEYGASSVDGIIGIKRSTNTTQTLYIVTSDVNAADPGGNILRWLDNQTQYLGQHTGIHLFTSRSSEFL